MLRLITAMFFVVSLSSPAFGECVVHLEDTLNKFKSNLTVKKAYSGDHIVVYEVINDEYENVDNEPREKWIEEVAAIRENRPIMARKGVDHPTPTEIRESYSIAIKALNTKGKYVEGEEIGPEALEDAQLIWTLPNGTEGCNDFTIGLVFFWVFWWFYFG